MPDLAVILVNWNTRALIRDALRALEDDLLSSGELFSAETWVVDNASTDGSAEAIRAEFPAVHLISLSENRGFAGGNNTALRELGFHDRPAANPTGPRAVFLLNSDTRVQTGATRILYETLLDTPRAGVVGARLEYGDGSFQAGAFAFPGLAQLIIDLYPLDWLPRRLFGKLYASRLNGRYPRAWFDAGRPFKVGHTLGATMLMRREAIEQTGLFDEQFYMYSEEVDWSMRIHRAGWDIYCAPQARVTHLAGQSTSQVRVASLLNLWKSRLRYYEKHYAPLKWWAARRLVHAGARSQARRASKAGAEEVAGAWRTISRL